MAFNGVLRDMMRTVRYLRGDSMADSTNPTDGAASCERLDSWKEIAAYLKRTERTARRWEKTEALPVCRHTHAKRDSVYAYKADLDAWSRARRTGPVAEGSSANPESKDRRNKRLAIGGASAGAIAIAAIILSQAGVRDIGPEPFKIVPLTSYSGYERYSSFSPDGSKVAFSWKGDGSDTFHIYTKTIGRDVPVQRTHSAADDLSPAWSPDGRFIAFLRSRPDERADLVLMPASVGPEQRLTSIFRPDSAPSSLILFGHDVAWTPDSKSLIVPGGVSAEQPFGLLLVSIETGTIRNLLSPAPKSGLYLAPSVSPDGRHLAFVRRTDFTVSEIWVNTLLRDFTPHGEARRLTYENRLTTSPVWGNADEILFLSGELGAEASLYRLSISDPGKPRAMPSLGEGAAFLSLYQPLGEPFMVRSRLAYTRAIKDHNIWRIESDAPDALFGPPRLFITSTRTDFNPQFSPDGSRIAFESTRSGSMEIWVANSDGSTEMQLTHFGGPLTGAARWSPDSQQIVFNSRLGGQADLYVISAKGGEPRRLTDDTSNEDLPSWSSDGRWVYFHSDRNGSSQVWKMPITGEQEPIQVTHAGALAALESLDGNFVYYSKGKALGPASLWRASTDVAKRDETQVLESLADWSTFNVVAHGIYFIPYPQAEAKSSINFLSFADGKTRRIADIEKPVSVGLGVSRDGLVILYTQVDRDDNDLMLASR